jgi:hypothetical protein
MSRIHSHIDTRSELFVANREHYDGLLDTLRQRTVQAMAGGSEKLRDRPHRPSG